MSADILLSVRDALIHRGPDDAGAYLDGVVGLGSRRLSIIDLSLAAHQPMSNEDGTVWVIHNGEIYNFPSLREDLLTRGHRFKSQSDTEVIVHGYEQWGMPGLLARLNGIFAFAIWDAREAKLLAARDHLGVKPFYFVHSGSRFLFASEIKALLAGGHPFELNEEAVEEQLIFRYVAGERTLVKGVERLPAGHYLELNRHGLRKISYWSPVQRYAEATGATTPDGAESILREAAVMQLISDVPVGVLCSGGIDSGLLTALAAERIEDLNTFCVSFKESGYDDSVYARMVSERYRTRHHQLDIHPEEFVLQLNEAVWANDEPLAHTHEAQLLNIARMAKPHVTVLLSGEGADELFGGYRRYELAHYSSLLNSATGRILGRLLRALPANGASRRLSKLVAFTEFTPAEAILYNSAGVFRTHLNRLRREWDGHSPYRVQLLERVLQTGATGMAAAMLYDQMVFLPSLLDRNDKMTMYASIECRVPFLDYRLVELANRLPARWRRQRGVGKRILRTRFRELLPEPIWQREKLGFGVPISPWFRRSASMRDLLHDLEDGELVRLGLFNQADVRDLIQQQRQGADDLTGVLWSLFTLNLWYTEVQRRVAGTKPSATEIAVGRVI